MYTYPISLRKSAVDPKFDMVKVEFPSGSKLFGTCKHGINGAFCRSCQVPRRTDWIDPFTLYQVEEPGSDITRRVLPACSWCKTLINQFSPNPTTRDRTHEGERGIWYLGTPLHYACLQAGEPKFHTFDGPDTQHSSLDAITEPDRNYRPEVQDLLGLPEDDLDQPFTQEQLEEFALELKEQDRYNALCGPVTIKTMNSHMGIPIKGNKTK